MSQSLVKYTVVQKNKFYGFSNKKLFKFIMLVFKSHTAMKEFARCLSGPIKAPELTKTPKIYQRFESNIEPHIRFMHINNLSSCGWVSIDKKKIRQIREYSNCDHSIEVDWKYVKPADNDDRMASFKIMGYDIECISCDHNFPQASRKTDKIIQIGVTMYRYGSMTCYEQHLLVLGECAKIKGTIVHCFESETDLIRGFFKLVSDIRPDFMAGYNNFGFDDEYIFERAKRLDKARAKKEKVPLELLKNKFTDEILEITGKVNNKYLMENEGLKSSLTNFVIKNLSSSALGDNELKFFQIPGIISIDMMKIIQRDHRLVGYKLDNVSANFITEGAIKIIEQDTTDENINVGIYTKSTKALENDSYIQIMIDDGYSSSPLSEGAKYHVNNIETIVEKKFNEKDKKEESFTYQCIRTSINKKDIKDLRDALSNPLLKVFWTFAKDDMHHTIINKNFKDGDPKLIRQIGKYCLKDCKLVNLLLAKLEIIVNSIGMAKVCHVPLSYLFLRGQGVKIFSLVSKKCREKGFLIPVLQRKKKDVDGEEDDSYEGATVITPKPDVYVSPIGVLDYSSLYPSSMIERNTSHECYLENSTYDNLPGYIYHDIYIVLKDKKGKVIRNLDGTPQKDHHRFAQEIVTDQQIEIELKPQFTKIIESMNKNIEKITKEKYYDDELMNKRLSIFESGLNKNIDKIKDILEITDDERKKQITEEKIKFEEATSYLKKPLEELKICKENFNKTIKDIAESTTIDSEKKKIELTKRPQIIQFK